MAKRRQVGFFERITYIIKGTESSIVELLVTIGPWLAPLTPASMTYAHVVGTLGFAQVWGWTTAISVEILGLASGHTWAKFHIHNKRYRAKADKLPVWPIVFTFGFYLAVVITINMAMDWASTTWATRIAKLGLIMLSVPAIVIVSIRAQHAKVLMEKEPLFVSENEPEVRQLELVQLPSHNGHPNTMELLKDYLESHDLSPHEVGQDGFISPSEIAELLGANPTTIRTGLYRLRNNGG